MIDSVIAIDGPAASGKSSVAKGVASKLKKYYINTGNMYRAAGLEAINCGINLDTASESILAELTSKTHITYVKGENSKLILTVNGKPADMSKIRKNEISMAASNIAKSKVIREWLVEEQRKLIYLNGIIMEGRDIGTNVFPDAKYKFFLTASPKVRAIRRLLQDEQPYNEETIKVIEEEIKKRDEQDSKREIAPLKQAENAILIDSSNLTLDEVIAKIINCIINC